MITRQSFLRLCYIMVFAPLAWACSEDVSEPVPQTEPNTLSVNGSNFSLSKGFIQNLGPGPSSTFIINVYLTTDGISYSNGDFTGTGSGIFLDFSSAEAGLPEGTYFYNTNNTAVAGTLFDAYIITDGDIDDDVLEDNFIAATGGLISVGREGNNYIIDFTISGIQASGSGVVSVSAAGNYTGTLETIP